MCRHWSSIQETVDKPDEVDPLDEAVIARGRACWPFEWTSDDDVGVEPIVHSVVELPTAGWRDRAKIAFNVFVFKVFADHGFDPDEFREGATQAFVELLRRKTEVSLMQCVGHRNEVGSSSQDAEAAAEAREEELALREALGQIISAELMEEAESIWKDDEEGYHTASEVLKVLSSELIGLRGGVVDRSKLPRDFTRRLLEEDREMLPGLPVYEVDMRLQTLSSHKVSVQQGDVYQTFQKQLLGRIVLRFQRDASRGSGALGSDAPWSLQQIVSAEELVDFRWMAV